LFLSIAYEKNINLDLIEEFKKNKRFLYSENEGEFREIIIDILENSNLSNLNNECQIIYGSKNIFASSKSRRIKKVFSLIFHRQEIFLKIIRESILLMSKE